MNALVLMTSLIVGQISTGPVYQNIHFTGQVRTKHYVQAKLPYGETCTVPVINGYMPSMRQSYNLQRNLVLDLYYDNKYPWKGSNPIIYDPECVAAMRETFVEKTIPMRVESKTTSTEQVRRLQGTIEELREQISNMNPPAKQFTPLPKALPEVKSDHRLKRPSEIDP